MDILKRAMAPVTDEAWAEIDEQVTRTLRGNLSARKLVDFDGPHGWDFSAVSLGRIRMAGGKPVKESTWGIRQVLPLVETRVPFQLDVFEIDNINRGAKDIDVDAACLAARKVAIFEETAVYKGLEEAGICGIVPSSPHKAVQVPAEAAGVLRAVEDAVVTLQRAGIGGPYALVANTALYQRLAGGDVCGASLRGRVEGLVGGGIHWTPVADTCLLLSTRGGDFELTVGQDLSIGYNRHTTEMVELYVTESFTFRVLEPAAAVPLSIES